MLRTLVVSLAFVTLLLPAARAEQPDALDKAPSQFAKLDGVKVHYKSLGKGETAVVFVHGWTADMTSWRYQVPALEGKARVVLVDLPGHGKSDKPKMDYTMDFFARAVNAVLEDAGVEKAVLAGHSMGTPVVRQFYRQYPKKTLALVAVDGSLRSFARRPEDVDVFVGRFEGKDFKENYARFIDSMIKPTTPAEVRKALKETLPTAPQHVAVSAMRNMFDAKVWKDDEIKVPLQALMANLPHWSEEYVKHVRKLAPKVDYQTMDGVGHFLMMEKPDEFNKLLLGFLEKQGVVKP